MAVLNFFQGFAKLIDAKAAFGQQQELIARLRGMRIDDARTYLAQYVLNMPELTFQGARLALGYLVETQREPVAAASLRALLRALEAARAGAASAAAAGSPAIAGSPAVAPVAESPRAVEPEPRSLEADRALIASWFALSTVERMQALDAELEAMTAAGFEQFRMTVDYMTAYMEDAIERHESNEKNAWGGSFEDQMRYSLASLKTGQRDRKFLARLQELKAEATFIQWVATHSDEHWRRREHKEAEAQRCEQSKGRQREAQLREQKAPPVAPEPVRASETKDTGGSGVDFVAMLPLLRQRLQAQLASGQVKPERRASYERLVEKIEDMVRASSAPNRSLQDKANDLARVRGLMAEFQEAYVTPGSAERLSGLASDARARSLEQHIATMKRYIAREAIQAPPGTTGDRMAELFSDVTRAHQELASLADDDAAVTFEREMLRVIAQGIQQYSLRHHLFLARPLWQCPALIASPHGLFYSGDEQLAGLVRRIAAQRRLNLPSVDGKYYGQARWDALRASHVSVFDLRGCDPALVSRQPAAARALAETAYELGLACALGKPVVIVTCPGDRVPFDVDIACVELDGADDERVLGDAIDAAWYDRQRSAHESSVAATLAFADALTVGHAKRHALEAAGWLSSELVTDPLALAGSLGQVLREPGLDGWQLLHSAWPGTYPDDACRSLFHVMPFNESWSDIIRDTVRQSCAGRSAYRRGDEAEEGRIIEAIWRDICSAHLVLVDITGLNLNVLMELGMVHAVGRPTLIVRQPIRRDNQPEPLPRNIEKQRVHEYHSPAELESLLVQRLV
ncbi:MAG: hypothetical protein RL685_4171 [Pseudomonadota bacterium]|jgi:hypothetical protein